MGLALDGKPDNRYAATSATSLGAATLQFCEGEEICAPLFEGPLKPYEYGTVPAPLRPGFFVDMGHDGFLTYYEGALQARALAMYLREQVVTPWRNVMLHLWPTPTC